VVRTGRAGRRPRGLEPLPRRRTCHRQAGRRGSRRV